MTVRLEKEENAPKKCVPIPCPPFFGAHIPDWVRSCFACAEEKRGLAGPIHAETCAYLHTCTDNDPGRDDNSAA